LKPDFYFGKYVFIALLTLLLLSRQSLVNATLPEGVVSTNITVSAKSRPSLLAELRHDEHLVWAHETVAPRTYF
jgi:hypothetical protein